MKTTAAIDNYETGHGGSRSKSTNFEVQILRFCKVIARTEALAMFTTSAGETQWMGKLLSNTVWVQPEPSTFSRTDSLTCSLMQAHLNALCHGLEPMKLQGNKELTIWTIAQQYYALRTSMAIYRKQLLKNIGARWSPQPTSITSPDSCHVCADQGVTKRGEKDLTCTHRGVIRHLITHAPDILYRLRSPNLVVWKQCLPYISILIHMWIGDKSEIE